MIASPSMKLSTFGKLPCAQCDARLIAPVWSEYVSETHVRHLWSCDDCGYDFETLVVFPADERASIAPSLAA
jgi:hypothetical protein